MQILKYFLTKPLLSLFLLATMVSTAFVLLDDSQIQFGKDTIEVNQPIIKRQLLPNPILVNKKKIVTLKVKPENTVLIFGEIGENSASIANRITSLSNNDKPTLVLINSPGGSVLDGALIVSAIEASKTPVYTICLQLCASMAAISHGHGSKRLMVDRSILMHHQASGGVQGSVGQMQARLDTLSRYVYKMDASVAARAGMSLENFLLMTASEKWIDAEDAVSMGFADGLVNLDLSEVNNQEFRTLVNKSSETIKTHFNIKLGDF